jgi:DNA-binding response OmpR family regulator
VASPEERPIRVLVVDDDLDLSKLIARALRQKEMRVVTVHDGISAVEEARRLKPHVAVVDIGLPHFDGHDLGKQLHSLGNGYKPRLVAMTADDRKDVRRRSMALGFDAHVLKPIDSEELVTLVQELGRREKPSG